MKLALRIVGLLYLLYGLFHFLQIPRLLSIYQDFGAEIHILNLVIIPLRVFVWSILLFVASSSQKFAKNIKVILLVISILLPIGFYVYGIVLPIYNLTNQY